MLPLNPSHPLITFTLLTISLNIIPSLEQNVFYYYQILMNKMLLVFSLCLLLMKVSKSNLSKQIPFQFYDQTYPYPSIHFYGKSGDLVNIMIQSDREVKQWYIILTTRLSSSMFDFSFIKDTISQKLAPQNSTSYSHQLNLFQDRQYMAILKIAHKNFDIFYTRIAVALNGQLIKQHYQIVQNFSQKPNLDHVYHIKTTKKCKAKMRFGGNVWGPKSIFLYSPNSQNNYTKADGGFQYYNLTFDTEGIWKLVFFFQVPQENIMFRYTINFTTFEDDKCINQCTDLNDSKVVAMAYLGQGKQVCICNQNITGIFWDQKTGKCNKSHSREINKSSCNQNGIKEEGQQCDSNHQEGCSGCRFVEGYYCVEYLDLSVCRKKTISIEQIVFIAFGAVAFLFVCTIVFIYCIKKKKKMYQESSEFKNYRNFRIKKAIKEGKMKEKSPELLNPSIPCGICLKSDCTIALAGCFHYFHGQCILEWLRTDKECPVCKKSYLQGLSSVENIKEQL